MTETAVVTGTEPGIGSVKTAPVAAGIGVELVVAGTVTEPFGIATGVGVGFGLGPVAGIGAVAAVEDASELLFAGSGEQVTVASGVQRIGIGRLQDFLVFGSRSRVFGRRIVPQTEPPTQASSTI